MGEINALIVGASGLAGGACLNVLLNRSGYNRVIRVVEIHLAECSLRSSFADRLWRSGSGLPG